jgi:hypothetical protein
VIQQGLRDRNAPAKQQPAQQPQRNISQMKRKEGNKV